MTAALIIGAGIAGTVTALALRKAGIDATVYEAHPTGADDVGAFLTMRPNGMDALRVLDADGPVAAAAFPAKQVEQFSGTGKRLGAFEMPRSTTTGNGSWTLTRAGLYRVLQDEAVARGIRIRHGKRLAGCTMGDTSGRVIAEFADGSQATGDLLIGADGLHSVTRTIIDPAAPRPRYTGITIVYGYAPGAPHPAPPHTYRMMRGTSAFFGYTTDPEGQSWWFARLSKAGDDTRGGHTTDNENDTDRDKIPQEWKRRVLAALAEENPLAAEIVRATSDRIMGGDGYDIPTVPQWGSDRLTLVGDAAHAASPAAAQGASMAAEDAIVVAKCLHQLSSPAQALAAYEALRRERVERLVAASAAISGPQGSGVAASDSKGPDWRDYPHIDWGTPVVVPASERQ